MQVSFSALTAANCAFAACLLCCSGLMTFVVGGMRGLPLGWGLIVGGSLMTGVATFVAVEATRKGTR